MVSLCCFKVSTASAKTVSKAQISNPEHAKPAVKKFITLKDYQKEYRRIYSIYLQHDLDGLFNELKNANKIFAYYIDSLLTKEGLDIYLHLFEKKSTQKKAIEYTKKELFATERYRRKKQIFKKKKLSKKEADKVAKKRKFISTLLDYVDYEMISKGDKNGVPIMLLIVNCNSHWNQTALYQLITSTNYKISEEIDRDLRVFMLDKKKFEKVKKEWLQWWEKNKDSVKLKIITYGR